MKTKYLTAEERREGKKHLYQFQTFNGIGFNFMGATPVYLLAIHFGANNFQLGYISSVIFLTGIILVALPRLLAGRNLVKVQALAWFARGLVILFYLFLFRMQGEAAIYLILIVYTMFSISRMIGMAVWNALVKMVADAGESGKVIAQGNILNQSSSVLARFISAVVTSFQYFSGIVGILLLQVLGVILNTAAVTRLLKIPCRETVEYTKGRNIFIILKDALKQKRKRYPLLLKWVIISIIVLNGLIIPFIKKEAGFGSSYVFLYSLVMTFSAILAGLFARTFADRIGSRPLLLGMSLLLILSFVIWALLPVSVGSGRSLSAVWYYAVGFFTNFFLLSCNILISRVVVNSMPEDETFSYNAMVNFVTALFSAAAGILGGFLINWGQYPTHLLFNRYSYLFIFGILLSVLIAFLSALLVEKGSLSGKETAAILFSFEGLRAYINIGKMQGAKNPVKKRTVLLSISENEAPAATEELKRILALPLSASKGEVIKSLFRHPRPVLLPELLQEAKDFGSYHQLKALFALGAYPDSEVEKLLLELLDNSDSAVRSNAAKSLGRIGNKSALAKVRLLAGDAVTSWDKINYLIALKNMDESGEYLRYLFEHTAENTKGIFNQTYYALVADTYEMKPSLSIIYQAHNLKKGNGLKIFLDNSRDHEMFFLHNIELITRFQEKNWQQIQNFCRESLNGRESLIKNIPGYLAALRSGITGYSEINKCSYDDALALVYFTYQILTYSKDVT